MGKLCYFVPESSTNHIAAIGFGGTKHTFLCKGSYAKSIYAFCDAGYRFLFAAVQSDAASQRFIPCDEPAQSIFAEG